VDLPHRVSAENLKRPPITCDVIDAAPRAAHHEGLFNAMEANMPSTNTTERIVDAHLAAYCEPNPTARQAAIGQLWNQLGRLVDPPFEAAGHDGIAGQAAMVVSQFPGHRFERTTAIDEHHGFARYGWRLVNASGAVAAEGIDVLEFDVDGRIGRVVGFFGAQPAAL
jgi:hypothetical protein